MVPLKELLTRGNNMAVEVNINKKQGYSKVIAVTKLAKNGAIFLLPSLVAAQTNVPQEYAWALAAIIYLIKNWLENKK